jgi:transcriptional regulator with XRE-family HTH domain
MPAVSASTLPQRVTSRPTGMAQRTDDNGNGSDVGQDLSEQAERLTALRKSTGLSRERFAARLGVHGNTVANWETGKVAISFDKAEQVARTLRVPLSDVLGYDPPERNPVATDETVRNCFGELAGRISELRTAAESRLDAQAETLDALLLEVRELARLVRGEALPDTGGASTETPRATQDPPGQ